MTDALKEIKSYFDDKLASLKEEILNEQDTKKRKIKQHQVFKYQSNKKQFEFNKNIKETLESTIKLIQRGSKYRPIKTLKERDKSNK